MTLPDESVPFTTLDGHPITLEAFLARYSQGQRKLFIGTDSKTVQHTKFSTVLVSYSPGHGGVLLKRSRRELKIASLQERLWKEAWYSVQLGLEITGRLRRAQIEIHLDVNCDERHRSGVYAPALVGLVTSQGFAYRIKPEAWCATCIADRLVRNR